MMGPATAESSAAMDHERAMALAERADRARAQGDYGVTLESLLRALRLECRAAKTLLRFPSFMPASFSSLLALPNSLSRSDSDEQHSTSSSPRYPSSPALSLRQMSPPWQSSALGLRPGRFETCLPYLVSTRRLAWRFWQPNYSLALGLTST